MIRVPISKPHLTEADRESIVKPFETGWIVQGPYVRQFEERFSKFCDVPYSIACSSCTTALHLAVTILGLRPGEEVLVPAFTWVSTPNVVEYRGARPVFCDIDPATFNLDVTRLEERITSRTVGIIPVHLFGLCADMKAILELARKRNLWVVEDAACGFGSKIDGQHAGTFGDMGCFSFHPRKSITTGEGGMITTAREDINCLARSLRDHGSSRSDQDRHQAAGGYLLSDYRYLGYNYRMTDLQGALGCAQLERGDWILEQRAYRASQYRERLTSFDWLQQPWTPQGYTHGYQSYVCMFSPNSPTLDRMEKLHRQRNGVMERLEQNGIATRQGTHAPVSLAYYREKYRLNPKDFPHAILADQLSLSLPLYPDMTDEDQARVCQGLEDAMGTLKDS